MMLQHLEVLQSSSQLHPPPPTPPAQALNLTTPACFLGTKKQCKWSRRELTICSNSSLLLLLSSQVVETSALSRAQAEENSPNKNDQEEKNMGNFSSNCDNRTPTKRAFLDISIDGEPVGRIIIGLYGDDAPAGAARFGNLVTGAAGISYRRKEFIKIMPNYVQHGGVRSYGVDAELARRTGSKLEADNLLEEWEAQNDKCPATRNLAGAVSIIVTDPLKPPPKIKLVAREGKLEIDQEEVGVNPNGTEFVIATRDSPELDASTLVVGRILGGMEVVERIGRVQTVRENTRSPYFR